MKYITGTLILLLMTTYANSQNKAVSSVDLARYSGKWYSLSSIPTMMDKNWRETVENYTLNKKGEFDVLTTYRKIDDPGQREISSKLFPGANSTMGDMKAQFFWPFKISYRIIELADDYSYTVIGHADRKYLFIMSRTPSMDPKLFKEIVARCKASGYETSKLVSQDHK